jgi:hypothetical protein
MSGFCGLLVPRHLVVEVPDAGGSRRRSFAVPRVRTIGELAAAVPDPVAVVMVHESAMRWLGLPARLPRARGEHAFIGSEGCPQVELGWRLTCRRGDGRPPVSVVLLAYDAEAMAGPWARHEPPVVSEALGLFHGLVTPWRGSVGMTAESLIEETHPRQRGGRRLESSPTVPEPVRAGGLEQPYRWRRDLTSHEWSAAWVHTFDQNAQYLSAWQAVEVGHGDPVEVAGGELHKAYGVWRAAVEESELETYLPHPAGDGLDGVPVWRMTPTLTRWAEWSELVGVRPPTVEAAWLWPNQSRYLRGAADRIRSARGRLLGMPGAGPALALEAVKALYRVQTGRFSMSYREAASPWARPDIGHAVRAQARVNLHRRLAKLRLQPFAVEVDGLAFATDAKDAHDFAASVGLPVGLGLGEFTVEHTSPLTEEIRKAGSSAAVFTEHKRQAV